MTNVDENNKEKILSGLGSGLNSINSKLGMVENVLDGKHLLKDKIQIVENRLKEELIELSSNVATIKTLIETLVKGQREILDLENREVPNDGY